MRVQARVAAFSVESSRCVSATLSSAVTSHAVRLTEERVVMPPECACCGGLASRALLEARFGAKLRVLVPYCADCHEHVARGKTRALTGAISSALLALTVTAGLPLLWQPPSAIVYALIAVLGAALPLFVLGRRRERPAPGHTAAGRAAFWGSDGALVCTQGDWAARLATSSNATIAVTLAREPATPPWAVLFPIVSGVAALLLFGMHFPLVRVLNVTDARLSIAVDGHVHDDVEPTSAESATAGISVRLPSGRHVLTAVDPSGRVVDTADVIVESGVQHLYAPGSSGVCFWVEATRYGRGGKEAPAPELLSRMATFWALSHDVDVWFAPSPRAGDDDRSSGGWSYAVRQAPCDDVPGLTGM
jgi:hypothetical protein